MTDEIDPAKELETLRAQLAETTKGLEALKAKNEELLGETKAAKAARREAEEKAKAEAEELARKAGDVTALEKSWQDKLAKREAELLAEVQGRDARLLDLTVNAEARRIASELAVPGSADVLLPHIKARLKYEDGRVTVLDADGKPSASTVDELAKEIAANKAFAPLIVASHASGGGANGGKGGGAATTKKVSEWSDGDKARYIREQGLDKWKELLKAQG